MVQEILKIMEAKQEEFGDILGSDRFHRYHKHTSVDRPLLDMFTAANLGFGAYTERLLPPPFIFLLLFDLFCVTDSV